MGEPAAGLPASALDNFLTAIRTCEKYALATGLNILIFGTTPFVLAYGGTGRDRADHLDKSCSLRRVVGSLPAGGVSAGDAPAGDE